MGVEIDHLVFPSGGAASIYLFIFVIFFYIKSRELFLSDRNAFFA